MVGIYFEMNYFRVKIDVDYVVLNLILRIFLLGL